MWARSAARQGSLVVYMFSLANLRICLAQEITSIHMHLASFQMPVEIIAIPSTNLKLGDGGTFHSQTKGPLTCKNSKLLKIVQTIKKLIKPQIKGNEI